MYSRVPACKITIPLSLINIIFCVCNLVLFSIEFSGNSRYALNVNDLFYALVYNNLSFSAHFIDPYFIKFNSVHFPFAKDVNHVWSSVCFSFTKRCQVNNDALFQLGSFLRCTT